ncbi:MAG TPA: M28 family peptidase, partial [Draconibacterium sp.]|nr:M28 family peptidase [Draconibacterium sp.]
MHTKLILLFVFIAGVFQVVGQKKALETITVNDLKAHLEFVASDLMQGRDFTTEVPGLDITADYLRTQCMKMGLKPGVDNYVQHVSMQMIKPDIDNTSFKIFNGNGETPVSTNDFFALLGPAKSDTIETGVVFAGYGWYNDKTKYNDTEGVNIKGKVVLAMTRNIEQSTADGNPGMELSMEMRKLNKMLMGGAKALILVPDPLFAETNQLTSARKYSEGGQFSLKDSPVMNTVPMPLIVGTTELADKLLHASGKTLAQLQQEINESGSPKSFDIEDETVQIILPKIVSDVDGKNVVAVVEGSDPVLKNECVVYTAHYDHLGMNAKCEVYNGADDNGTGTVSLLEIAEAFQSMKKKPARSIVFAWVTAEEKGLYGSDFYSQHPVFPLDKTLVDINLDMVGRSAETEADPNNDSEDQLAGPNGLFVVTGKQSTELMTLSKDLSEDLGLVLDDKLSGKLINRSDYYHFYKHGIPVLGLSTGIHEDYHKVTDELDKIDYVKMERVVDYAFLLGEKVASQKKRIVVDKPANK